LVVGVGRRGLNEEWRAESGGIGGSWGIPTTPHL